MANGKTNGNGNGHDETADIATSTVILALSLGQVSNRRKIDSESDSIQTDIDRSMLHLSKDLFDCEEQKNCSRFLWNMKGRIKEKSVPSFFKAGMYMVKLDGFEELDKMLKQSVEDFKPIIQAFADVVDQRRAESKARLGSSYKESEFPTYAQVLEGYSIKWNWLTMSTPSSLKKLNKAIYERECQKAEESLKLAVEEITTLLTVEAKKLADHLVDRLTPGEDGKPKKFHHTLVTNISEFLANFNMRNIGTSEALNEQIERMRKLVSGVSTEDLRNNDRLKEDMANGFSEVAKAFDAMIVNRPKRFIDLESRE